MKKLKKQLLSSTSHYAMARNSMHHESERAKRKARNTAYDNYVEAGIGAGMNFVQADAYARRFLSW